MEFSKRTNRAIENMVRARSALKEVDMFDSDEDRMDTGVDDCERLGIMDRLKAIIDTCEQIIKEENPE
jgi:hypothetical protein